MTDRTLHLTKHHGLGNDFLVVFHPRDVDLPSLARRLCDRRRGIGADGLLVGESAPEHSAQVAIFNADGSRAEMSGNGVRCFAQALAARRGDDLAVVDRQTLRTDAGTRVVTLRRTEDPNTLDVSVDMGAVEELDEPEGWSSIGVHEDRPVAHLGLGNPHAVVGVDSVDEVDLVAIGSLVPSVNVEIVEPGPERNAITMRVHERGAGITEACGTGACAAAWAARRWGLASDVGGEIVVHMVGGTARVTLDQPALGAVTLVGPATYIATIEVPIP